jgi:hypothetical protein
MASRKQPTSEQGDFTPKSRLAKALPAGATTVYLSPDLVVVADKPASGGGGAGRPKITVCKCTRTEYKCHTQASGDTLCQEECVEWDCTEM